VIEELRILEELQGIDNEIDALYTDGGNLPEEIERLTAQWREKQEAFKAKQDRLDEYEKEQRRLEREIVEAQNAMEKFNKQLSRARNNKEYRVLEQQINDKEFLVLELDEELAKLKDKTIALKDEIEAETPVFEQEQAAFESQLKTLQAQLDDLEGNLAIKRDERNRVSLRLKKSLFRKYERLRQAYNNVVVPIQRGACSGCNMTLPPQTIAVSKGQDRILDCINCGRIIYWDGDY